MWLLLVNYCCRSINVGCDATIQKPELDVGWLSAGFCFAFPGSR